MFDQIKKFKELKKIQDDLKKEKIFSEKNGIKVVLSGDFLVEEIILNPLLNNDDQALILKDVFNEAIQKIQISIFQKLSKII